MELRGFKQVDIAPSSPDKGEVLVDLKAASVNFRDYMIAGAQYPIPVGTDLIPLCDGAWEVVDIGSDVKSLKVGDRVINTYSRDWIEGPLEAWMWATAFGAELDGTLCQQRVFLEQNLVKIPESLSFEEASTIPCAAVTAWNALFHGPKPLHPGQTVLTLGTGGVSIFALQLANAAGMRVIATTSTSQKMERLLSLGADHVVNYNDTPEWQTEIIEATDGEGVDVAIEVGGPGTMNKSIAALRHGGWLSFIGALADPTSQIEPFGLLQGHKTICPIMVGNRRHTREVVRALDINKIQPVIDHTVAFDNAPDAIASMPKGNHFGKIVISR